MIMRWTSLVPWSAPPTRFFLMITSRLPTIRQLTQSFWNFERNGAFFANYLHRKL